MMRKLGKLWLWIVYAFLFLPIFVVIAYSFNAAKYTSAWKGFTLKWYSQLFGNAALIDAVVNTLSVAALAASLATLLGCSPRCASSARNSPDASSCTPPCTS